MLVILKILSAVCAASLFFVQFKKNSVKKKLARSLPVLLGDAVNEKCLFICGIKVAAYQPSQRDGIEIWLKQHQSSALSNGVMITLQRLVDLPDINNDVCIIIYMFLLAIVFNSNRKEALPFFAIFKNRQIVFQIFAFNISYNKSFQVRNQNFIGEG